MRMHARMHTRTYVNLRTDGRTHGRIFWKSKYDWKFEKNDDKKKGFVVKNVFGNENLLMSKEIENMFHSSTILLTT